MDPDAGPPTIQREQLHPFHSRVWGTPEASLRKSADKLPEPLTLNPTVIIGLQSSHRVAAPGQRAGLAPALEAVLSQFFYFVWLLSPYSLFSLLSALWGLLAFGSLPEVRCGLRTRMCLGLVNFSPPASQ